MFHPKLKHALRMLARTAALFIIMSAAACVFTRMLGWSLGWDALMLIGLFVTHALTIMLGTDYKNGL